VFSALLGVWQSLPYLFADFPHLRRASGPASWTAGEIERSSAYRRYLFCLAVVPLLLLRWPVKQLQLAFGLTGAMLLPLLAFTLLVMNNREPWVGRRFLPGIALNVVLAAALGFFAWVGISEVLRLLA
jgi:hypothetical protein